MRITDTRWDYDNADRLLSETIDSFDNAADQTESFLMDLVGNRLSRTLDKPSTAYVDQVFASTYDANDRLSTETRDNGINGVGIDQTTAYAWNGSEQATKTVSGAGLPTVMQTFSYNLQGQLSRVENQSVSGAVTNSRSRVDYRYDAAGIRSVSIESTDGDLNTPAFDTVAGNRTEYLTDHQSLTGHAQTIVETTKNLASQTIKRVTTTFGSDEITQTVSLVDPTSQLITQSSTLSFGHDGHGSVSQLFDAAGALVQVFQYTAYGDLLSIHNGAGTVVGTVGTPDLESLALTTLQYSGEAFDSRIGLQYLRARMVDPSTGRFTTLDPYSGDATSPFSFNKYAYTSGDPVQHSDPTGMFEGLAGLIGSISIGSSNQSRSNAANVSTGVRVTGQLRRLKELQRLLKKIQNLAEKFEDVFELLDVSPAEKKELTSSFNSLSVLPTSKIGPLTVKLPKKITNQLRFAVNMARNLGGLVFLQEQLGEWGTSIASSVAGLQHTTMTLHKPQGIDQLRFHKDLGFWAVIEAKGGKSPLSTEAAYGKEMSPKWMRHWINYTLKENDRSAGDTKQEFTSLKSAWNANDYLLAAVVRVNIERVTWAVKLTVQKFKKSTPTLNWPRS